MPIDCLCHKYTNYGKRTLYYCAPTLWNVSPTALHYATDHLLNSIT